jgi:imidazolonepropionase-like amidohydrolase
MSYQQILASLTTNPARRFGFHQHSGRIAERYEADLVVLRSDPTHNATAFAEV